MEPFAWLRRPGSPSESPRAQRRRRGARRDQRRRFDVPLRLEVLERRNLLAADFAQFVDPHPAPGNGFGATVVPLSTGNVVITAPLDDAGATDAGAVYLFNGATGALISTLTGSTFKDHIGDGGVTALANGNFVVLSLSWDLGVVEDSGAVTFGDGNSGISGVVSGANSLVNVAFQDTSVVPLLNGNYLVRMPGWNGGVGAPEAGAVTFGDGNSGVAGLVNLENTLFGSTANDHVGASITVLTNGNYVVNSPEWDNGAATDAGAVTFCYGNTGLGGYVSAANSLVGSRVNDRIGNFGVVGLADGDYVVLSPYWDRRIGTGRDTEIFANAGAVTFGNGTTGFQGSVNSANSLIGSTANDYVGFDGVTVLANGNYVVASSLWDNAGAADAGAATFGSGATGVKGLVSAANSLVGSRASDKVGSDVIALTNGDYVVRSPSWDRRVLDHLNEVIFADAGAATFGSGTIGISGAVSSANSLIGGKANDLVSSGGVTALTNGNYVVRSPWWDNGTAGDAGAATFGGTGGISGLVSSANSLVGSTANDQVGGFGGGVTALTNGNYVVSTALWDLVLNGLPTTDAGAVTFGNGNSGVSGQVSYSNSLTGRKAFDQVGSTGGPAAAPAVTALANGNYVVRSPLWDNDAGPANVGAVTFGDGDTGISGFVTAANSLVGTSSNDQIGSTAVTPLANGNYVVRSSLWHSVGAVTFGDGNTGISGAVNDTNSLVGSHTDDQVGNFATALTNGNYVVRSTVWDNGAATNAGAVTFGDGANGISGVVSAANSLVGASKNDAVGSIVTALTNGNYVVATTSWDNGATADAGAVTFGDGTTGVRGLINSLNSAIGAVANTNLAYLFTDNQNGTFFGRFVQEAGGILRVGSQQDGFNGVSMIASFGGDQNYTENADPISISDTAAISEVDYAALAGLTLTVSLTAGGQESDRLGIRTVGTGTGEINVNGSEVRIGDVVLGTFSGGDGTTPLVITLGSDATTPRVQTLLRNITFSNVSDNPPTAARTLRAILSDAQGLASAAVTKQIGVTAVNDAPVLDNSLNQTLKSCAEDATAPAASDVASLWITGVTDPDGPARGIAVTSASSYSGTWQYLLAGSNTWTGMGVVSNSEALLLPGSAKVRFLPKHDFNGVVSLRYRAWDGTGPDAAGDKVDTVGNTGGSTPFSTAQESASLTVKAVNDKPVLSFSGTIGYVHDAKAVTLTPFARVTDVDSPDFAGGRLRVRITDGAGTTNRLAIGAGFTVDAGGNVLQGTTIIGKRVSNGFGINELVITFNASATKAIVQQLVRAITFKTVGGAAGPRKVIFTVSDGDGGLSAEVFKTVNVT